MKDKIKKFIAYQLGSVVLVIIVTVILILLLNILESIFIKLGLTLASLPDWFPYFILIVSTIFGTVIYVIDKDDK